MTSDPVANVEAGAGADVDADADADADAGVEVEVDVEAAADADSDAAAERRRRALVDRLLEAERIRTGSIRAAMLTVPRHLFVPQASLDEAYAESTVDVKLDSAGTSISCASEPGVVAMMLEQLQPRPGDNVLELGAGTGYNAGLLAHLVGARGHVTTIDVDDDLVDGARDHLAAAGFGNATVLRADGALGHPDGAPYDRIIAAVGAYGIPPAWLDQLAPGGRLLVPQRLRGSVCRSIAYEHQNGAWVSVSSEMNTFMPLRDGIAADDRRWIPLAANGSILLQTHSGQEVDAAALAGVLDRTSTVSWSDVTFRGRESPDWMELWLTCALPSGLNRMRFGREAVGGLLSDDPYPSSSAAFDQGALAYLTRRLSDRRTPDGDRLWEFGVVGHGPDSDDLVARVVESMRAWDREYRASEARFELQPLGLPPLEPSPGRFSFDTTLHRLVVTWR